MYYAALVLVEELCFESNKAILSLLIFEAKSEKQVADFLKLQFSIMFHALKVDTCQESEHCI
jgi:hypothetical protein